MVGVCNSLAVVLERQQGWRDWRVSKPPTISMRAAQPLVGLEKRATKPVTTALGEMLAVQYTWSLVWDCH